MNIPTQKTDGGGLPPGMDITSPSKHPRDPLHGISLESILNQLVQRHGWGEMGRRIPIRCFQFNPTVKSSLTFLRGGQRSRSIRQFQRPAPGILALPELADGFRRLIQPFTIRQ